MKRIKTNFLVISNYYNDISWVAEYTNKYIVYDQSGDITYPTNLDPLKIIKSPHLGHNVRDYCTFIIDNYDNLPDVTIFATGNIFPRHVSQKYFDTVINNTDFTPIEEPGKHKIKFPIGFIDNNGGLNEYNNSWYLKHHPTKYFHSYNDFIRFCFKHPEIPKYIRLTPGANYVIPKSNIKKYPKVFYENLRFFVSHCSTNIPGESHILERAFYTIWTGSNTLNEVILEKIDENFKGIQKTIEPPSIEKFFTNIIIKKLNFFNFIKEKYHAFRKNLRKLMKH